MISKPFQAIKRNGVAVTAYPKKLIALDFDGVVCDSVGESSLSAIKAAVIQWPELFNTRAARDRTEELVEKMRAVRPVIETGYENIVQIRCLYEGVTAAEMLEGWEHMLSLKMKEWQLDRAELVTLFGKVRDDWIQNDVSGWLAPNRIFEGVATPIQKAMNEHEVYIVTTKQAHYTELLLRDMAEINLGVDRIFSQTISGRPKSEVLAALAAKHPGVQAHIFVEDKLSTLEKVSKDPLMSSWQLYLVDWGYNTATERQRLEGNARIKVINKTQFAELLQ